MQQLQVVNTPMDDPRHIALRLTAINTLHYLNRYMVPALLPSLSLELSLSHTQGGAVVSAFVLGYFLASPAFGYAGDRVSKIKLMRLSVLGWGAVTAASAFPSTFITLLILRVLVGVGQAGFVTLAPAFLKSATPDARTLTSSLSYFFAAIPVGAALGYVAGGYLTDAFSWRSAFLVGGCLCCASVLLLPSKSSENEESKTAFLPIKDALYQTLKTKAVTIAIAGYALNTFALTSVATFVPTYGVGFGFSLAEISTIFGLILVATGAIGTVLGGKVAENLASRSSSWGKTYFRFTGITTLIAVPFFALSFWTSHWIVFLVACAIAELFVFAGVASLNAILVNECEPSLVSFTQGATVFTINLLGSLPGPIVTGFIADQMGLRFSLLATTAALLGSSILWLFGGKESPKTNRFINKSPL